MFQRKIHHVLLKGCHALSDNRRIRKKFDFPKVVHKADCPSKYYTFGHQIQVCCALVCSNERSTASCSKSIMNSSKIAQRKFDFPIVVQILHMQPPKSSMLCFDMFQRKIYSVLLKVYHELFENRPKKFWFPKSCPQSRLSEQILWIPPPKSSMLCFDIFQWKINSVLRKGYHSVSPNRP